MANLKAEIAKKNVFIGTKSVVKNLKNGNVKSVVVATNCPDDVRDEISRAAKINGVEVESYSGTGKELGIFCGKPFGIAVIAIKK